MKVESFEAALIAAGVSRESTRGAFGNPDILDALVRSDALQQGAPDAELPDEILGRSREFVWHAPLHREFTPARYAVLIRIFDELHPNGSFLKVDIV
ncbi:MAG: hypothetical protein ACF8MF_06730 [Phycisphaerales bacterium JB052]